jgi:hypothetical protein
VNSNETIASNRKLAGDEIATMDSTLKGVKKTTTGSIKSSISMQWKVKYLLLSHSPHTVHFNLPVIANHGISAAQPAMLSFLQWHSNDEMDKNPLK